MTLLLTSLLIYLAIELMGMEKQAVNRRRDTSAFKNRFSLYKQGIPVYDRGRIIPYEDRDYDYAKANELGYTPDETGHMPTRDYKTGAYLKSVTHPTLMKSIVSDLGEGYIPVYNEQDGHMYSHRFPDDLPVREESKIPEYADGKVAIGHNVSHAKINNDGTFTDDYTRTFEDMVVTPKRTELKRGSYSANNWNYAKAHRKDWMKTFLPEGVVDDKPLEAPSVDPFLIALTGGRMSGDLIGDIVGIGADKATKLATNAAISTTRGLAKTSVGKRMVETAMRTSGNPVPFNKIKTGLKTFDKDRAKAVANYIIRGKKKGPFGYYNSFADEPSLAYTGFVNKRIKDGDAPDLDMANVMLHDPNSRYGDAIDAYLYNKEISPEYGFLLSSIGRDFGPHEQYISNNYKKVSKNIPVYTSPPQTLEIALKDYLNHLVNPLEIVSDEGYIRGDYSPTINSFVEYDAAGHLKQLGSLDGIPMSREQDIWKYLPKDYKKYSTELKGVKRFIHHLGTHAVDAAGTPIIVRTPWQYNPRYSAEFVSLFNGYKDGKLPYTKITE